MVSSIHSVTGPQDTARVHAMQHVLDAPKI